MGENTRCMAEYIAADHGLGGLQRASEVALLPGLYSNVDNGENCGFSLLFRFVKKNFGGVYYYGIIIGYKFPYYEVFLSFLSLVYIDDEFVLVPDYLRR